ncbi:MAG: hypothetical protein HZA54_16285 [Planctomycetes bacterium]|nr:hypothetical protein [Planctomycetota bacterium]
MSTTQDELKQILLRQKAQQQADTEPDPADLRTEWLEELQALLKRIDGWLAPLRPDYLAVETGDVELEEYGLGKYQAPARRVRTPSGRVVEIMPHGRRVLDAIGRVDLLAPPWQAMLVRFEPGKWFFVTSPLDRGGVNSQPLTEESFFGVLKEMLQ